MPGLYDSYQLANSHAIPQYQGSAIPELTQVASTLENRYDQGVQQADLLSQALDTSTAATPDQPVLNQLKDQYRQKLAGYAQKGDYENMWRNVALDARDFANKYKTIDANRQAIQGWSTNLDKQVGEGKLDPSVAAARKLQMQDTYTGLKTDPETGQLTNMFQGAATVPSVDIPKKVNEWLQNSHAIEKGWKMERDENGMYVTNGVERKSLPWDDVTNSKGQVVQQGLKHVIDAGIQLDPEVKAYLHQEHELAPYYAGITRKINPDQLKAITNSSPMISSAMQEHINAGMDPVSALQTVIGDQHVRNRINDIYDYARKGVINDSKTEYGEKMDEVLADRLKKNNQHFMFSAPISDVGPGQEIKGESDFNDILSQAATDREAAYKALGAFKNAPGIVQHNDGSLWQKQPDGSFMNVDKDADALRQTIKAKEDNYQQLLSMKKAAAQSAGYDPDKASPAVRAEAQRQADLVRHQKLAELTGWRDEFGALHPGLRPATSDDNDAANEAASKIYSKTLSDANPAFKDYESELEKRMKPQGVSNRIWIFNDDAHKKALGDFVTNAVSNLGAKGALTSMQIGSGKDTGKDLDASDFDALKGRMVPVGIMNDAKTGEPKVVFRGLQDIKGKKTSGENIIVSMKDMGGLDEYMKSQLGDQEYSSYKMDQIIKGGLNNQAGQYDVPDYDKNGNPIVDRATGKQESSIRVVRHNSDKQNPGSYGVQVHTESGVREIPANTTEGVADLINRYRQSR